MVETEMEETEMEETELVETESEENGSYESDFSNIVEPFYRKIPFLKNEILLQIKIFSFIQRSVNSLKKFYNKPEIKLGELFDNSIRSSLFDSDFFSFYLHKLTIDGYDSQSNNLYSRHKSGIEVNISVKFSHWKDVKNKNFDPKFCLNMNFAAFQCNLFKLLLPSPKNKITCLFVRNGSRVVTSKTIFVEARKYNAFFYKYACANLGFYREKRASRFLSHKIPLRDITDCEKSIVQKYALPLYDMIRKELCYHIETACYVTSIEMPDFVHVRLLYEISYYLYVYLIIYSRKNVADPITLLENEVGNLWEDIFNMFSNVKNTVLYINLREDRKVLLLVHLLFAEIKYSYSLIKKRWPIG